MVLEERIEPGPRLKGQGQAKALLDQGKADACIAALRLAAPRPSPTRTSTRS